MFSAFEVNPASVVARFNEGLWDCSVGPAYAADDRAEDIGGFETNQLQPLGVGLRALCSSGTSSPVLGRRC